MPPGKAITRMAPRTPGHLQRTGCFRKNFGPPKPGVEYHSAKRNWVIALDGVSNMARVHKGAP